MRKKLIGVMLAAAMVTGLAGCGSSSGTGTSAAAADTQATEAQKEEAKDDAKKEDEKEDSEASDTEGASDFHIGIVTGSVSQSEDDRRGAEAFQAMYGEDMVKLAIYPDNFTEELETTIQTIVNLSDDPKMKAIIRTSLFQAQPRLSVRSKRPALTFSVLPARDMRIFLRLAAQLTWSATTTSLPVAT